MAVLISARLTLQIVEAAVLSGKLICVIDGHSFRARNVKCLDATPSGVSCLDTTPSRVSPVWRSRSIGVPMFGDHAVLDAKHVEPERLMMLTIFPGPCLADVDDDHVVVADYI
jgi:hypothetical protein